MDEIDKIIQEQSKKLPNDVRQAIASADVSIKINAITKAHNLHIDQAGALEMAIMLVMIGLEHPSNFAANIVEEVGISELEANIITKEVNDKIFLPIRDSLMRMAEEMERESEDESRSMNSELRVEKEKQEEVKPVSGIQQIKPANQELDREKLLSEIEGHTNSVPENLPTEETDSFDTKAGLPMITGNQTLEKMPLPEDKLTKVVAMPTITTPPQQNPIKKIDPYREPIK